LYSFCYFVSSIPPISTEKGVELLYELRLAPVGKSLKNMVAALGMVNAPLGQVGSDH